MLVAISTYFTIYLGSVEVKAWKMLGIYHDVTITGRAAASATCLRPLSPFICAPKPTILSVPSPICLAAFVL